MRLLISVTLALILLAACGKELSVDQQIIATLRNMEVAAEEGEHFEFMSYVHDDFTAEQGTMDRRGFHRFMVFQINQNRRLQGQFFGIFVTETGEGMASANFRILVTGGGGLVPERGRMFDVETDFVRDGGDWKLLRADWRALHLPDASALGIQQ